MNGDQNSDGWSRIFKSSLTAAVSSKEISNPTFTKCQEEKRQAAIFKESHDEAELESADKIISHALKNIGSSAYSTVGLMQPPVKQCGRGRGRGKSQTADIYKVTLLSKPDPSGNPNIKETYKAPLEQSSKLTSQGKRRIANVTENVPSKLNGSNNFPDQKTGHLSDTESTSDRNEVKLCQGGRSCVSELTVPVRRDHFAREEIQVTQKSSAKDAKTFFSRSSLEGNVFVDSSSYSSKGHGNGKAGSVLNKQEPVFSQASSNYDKPVNTRNEPFRMFGHVKYRSSKDRYKAHGDARETMYRNCGNKTGVQSSSGSQRNTYKQNNWHQSHKNVSHGNLRQNGSYGREKRQEISTSKSMSSSMKKSYISPKVQIYENTQFTKGEGSQKIQQGFMSLKSVSVGCKKVKDACQEGRDLDCRPDTTIKKSGLPAETYPVDLYGRNQCAYNVLSQDSCIEQTEVVMIEDNLKDNRIGINTSKEYFDESTTDRKIHCDKISKETKRKPQQDIYTRHCNCPAKKSIPSSKLQDYRHEAKHYVGDERLESDIFFCKDAIEVKENSELNIQPQKLSNMSDTKNISSLSETTLQRNGNQLMIASETLICDSKAKKPKVSSRSVSEVKVKKSNDESGVKLERNFNELEVEISDFECKMKCDGRNRTSDENRHIAVTCEEKKLVDEDKQDKDVMFDHCGTTSRKSFNSFNDEQTSIIPEDDVYVEHDEDDSDVSAIYETCDTTESDEDFTLAVQNLDISRAERVKERSDVKQKIKSEILSQPSIFQSYSDTEINQRKLRQKERKHKPFASSQTFAEQNTKIGTWVESSHISDICSRSSSDVINSTISEISSEYNPDLCSQSECERSPDTPSVANKKERTTDSFRPFFRHFSQSPDGFPDNSSKDPDLSQTPTKQNPRTSSSQLPQSSHKKGCTFPLSLPVPHMPPRVYHIPASVFRTSQGQNQVMSFVETFSSDIEEVLRDFGENPLSLDAVISISLHSYFPSPVPRHVHPQTNFCYPPKPHYSSSVSSSSSSASSSLSYPPSPYWHMRAWPEWYCHNMGASLNNTAEFGLFNPAMAYPQNISPSLPHGNNNKGCVPLVGSSVEGGFNPWMYPFCNPQRHQSYDEQLKSQPFPNNPVRDRFEYWNSKMATEFGDNINPKCPNQDAHKGIPGHIASERGKCGDASETPIICQSKNGINIEKDCEHPISLSNGIVKTTNKVMRCQAKLKDPHLSTFPSKRKTQDCDAKTEYIKQASISSFLSKAHLTNDWSKTRPQDKMTNFAGANMQPAFFSSNYRRVQSPFFLKEAPSQAETTSASSGDSFSPIRNEDQCNLRKRTTSPPNDRKIKRPASSGDMGKGSGNHANTFGDQGWKLFTPIRNEDQRKCASSSPNDREVKSPASRDSLGKGSENQTKTVSSGNWKRFVTDDQYPVFVPKVQKPRAKSTESPNSRLFSPLGTSCPDLMFISKANARPGSFHLSPEITNSKFISRTGAECYSSCCEAESPQGREPFERGGGIYEWHSPFRSGSLDSPVNLKFHQNTTSPSDKYSWMKSGVVLEWAKRFVARSKTYQHKFIDSHCHIDLIFARMFIRHCTPFKKFKEELADFFPQNYEGCVAVFCNPRTFFSPCPKDFVLKTVAKEDGVWLALGCHPKSATDFGDSNEEGLRHILKHPKVVALGEIGLDYSKKFERHASVQKQVFRRQLRIAMEMKLPLVIHCRDADDDCLEILKQEVPSDHKIHAHCFTRDITIARRWMDPFPNLFLGLTPIISYKTAVGAINTALEIPLDRLLLETDAPYFVPGSIRNTDLQISFPGFALYTAEVVAVIKGISVDTVLKACRENTYKMYGI